MCFMVYSCMQEAKIVKMNYNTFSFLVKEWDDVLYLYMLLR